MTVVVAVLTGLVLMMRAGANVAPAHVWHYPCHEHLLRIAHWLYETFTPNKLFWEGKCLQ